MSGHILKTQIVTISSHISKFERGPTWVNMVEFFVCDLDSGKAEWEFIFDKICANSLS